jgi:predicted GTPase
MAPPKKSSLAGSKLKLKVTAPELSNLRHLVSFMDPTILQIGVERGVKVLNSLDKVFSEANSSNINLPASWKKAMESLRSFTKPSRTVVAVMGNTGAGKSSVVNALLDEEKCVTPRFTKLSYIARELT